MSQFSEIKGLTSQEVQERIARGDVNVDANVHTRSIKQICYDNLVTLFNIVNVILAIIVFFTGSYKNMLFMVIITANVVIGIVQEIRSKNITDKLSIVASSKTKAIRDGQRVEIDNDQIVRDDYIILGRGDQVPADCTVVAGTCDCNESLLTGESDLIHKEAGCELMSGSFVNAGMVCAQVTAVGAESYANRISAEAKQHKKVESEIMDTLNKIVKYVSIALPFVGALLFCSMFFGGDAQSWRECVLSTVAALIGMIPEGLILLTSSVLCISVIRLAKSQVLVQQLYCIETLARVDTLCLDKTGTITTGEMAVRAVECLSAQDDALVDRALASLVAADNDPNETSNAIKDYYAQRVADGDLQLAKPARMVPFSSDKKWSGGAFEDGTAFVMGAGQFVLKEHYDDVRNRVEELAANARVLVLAQVEGFTPEGNLVGTPRPLAFVCIHDKIRPTAAQTIAYFREQGVTVNVISGDDPRTVAGIAAQVGVEGADKFVDATTLKTDEDVAAAMKEYHVFGRVKPEQKKQFVVALQEQGHTVAMTGDGVNDTLALKQANCSVAMASGSDAARNVAHLVLVDNDFASMPKVVAEGRRSINNLQRSASLFLVKTLFSITMAVLFIALGALLEWRYPFQPIQMTLVSAMTIGLPSFVLALEPNHDRVKGHFLTNVIVRAIPGAITVVVSVLIANILGHLFLGWDYGQVSTVCVMLTAWTGVMLIIRLSVPFTPIRIALLVVVVLGMILGSVFMGDLFAISPFTPSMWIVFLAMGALICVIYQFMYNLIDHWYSAKQATYV